MLRRTPQLVACILAVVPIFGCGGTSTEQVIGPTATRCQITVPAPPATLPASGSTVALNVSATRDCAWTATSEAPWMTVNPASGQGSAAVSVTVAPNPQAAPRSGGIAVNDARVTVSQEPSPCRFELGSQSVRIGFDGGNASVRVTTQDGCEWRVNGSGSWLRALTAGGTGSGTVDISVDRNDGGERTATLSIAGSSFVVVQNAVRAPGSPNPSSCGFSIDPDRATFRSGGGQGSVRIATDPDCVWTASNNPSWISLQRSGGSGPDTLTYQVSANTSTTSDRSGSFTVAGHSHRVTQQACGLSIDSGVPNFSPAGGDGSFRVSTDPGCTWTASSTVDWILVTRSSGSGSTDVTFRVAPNSVQRDRSGTVVVSGRTKTIIQQALGQGGP